MFLFMLVIEATTLVGPFMYGLIIDAIVEQKPMVKTALFIAVAVGAHILYELLAYAKERFEQKNFDFALPRHMATETLKQMFTFSIGQHTNKHSGLKQSVITEGEHSLSTLAFTTIYQLAPMVLHAILVTGVLLYFSLLIGAVVMAGILLFVWITTIINRRFKDQIATVRDLGNEANKFHSEILRNVRDVALNVQEDHMCKEYNGKLLEYSGYAYPIWTRYFLWNMGRNSIAILTKFSAVSIGAYYAYIGVYTPGYVIVILMLVSHYR